VPLVMVRFDLCIGCLAILSQNYVLPDGNAVIKIGNALNLILAAFFLPIYSNKLFKTSPNGFTLALCRKNFQIGAIFSHTFGSMTF
jgi:hypothetical protein